MNDSGFLLGEKKKKKTKKEFCNDAPLCNCIWSSYDERPNGKVDIHTSALKAFDLGTTSSTSAKREGRRGRGEECLLPLPLVLVMRPRCEI